MYDELQPTRQDARELADPATAVEGGGNLDTHSFSSQDRDRDRLEDYETAYKQSEVVAQLVDTRALMTFGTGVEFTDQPGDPPIQVIDGHALTPAEWLNDTLANLDNRLVQLGTDAYVYGDAFVEIVETDTGGFDRLVSVNPKTLEAKFDEKGQLQEWIQTINKDNRPGSVQARFSPEDIAHIKLHTLGRKPLGVSLVGRNWEAITRYEKNQRAIREALNKHGFSRWHVTVGGPVDDRDVRRVRTKFKNNQYQTLVTGDNINVDELDQGATVGDGISEIVNTNLQSLAAGFGVPEEMAGLGRGSTEATAKVRLQAFERAARAEQRRMADQFINQVVNVILSEYSPFDGAAVDLRFDDVVSDETAAAEWLKNFKSTFTHNEVRDRLGAGPVPEDSEIDGDGPAIERQERIRGGDGGTGSDGGSAVDINEEAADLLQKVGNWLTVNEARDILGLPPKDDPDIKDEFGAPGRIGEKQADQPPEGDEGGGGLFASPIRERRELVDAQSVDEVWMPVIENVLWREDADDRMLFVFDDTEIPQFVMDALETAIPEAVTEAGANVETLAQSQLDELSNAMLDALDPQHGWSIKSISEEIQDIPGAELSREEADVLARDITHSAVAKARERGYKQRDDFEELRFDWVGPSDSRTTEACSWIKDQIPESGVSMAELKELVQEANQRFVDHDAREFSPHIQCRHQPVRTVD